MKLYSRKYQIERKKEIIKQQAQLNYKDSLRVYLSFTLKELKEMNHPIYHFVNKKYPDLNENTTLHDARIVKLFEKVFIESSQKAIELTFKLDGSLDDTSVEPDYDEINENTEGIK